jgi:mono/diheme cytochrome c family protein
MHAVTMSSRRAAGALGVVALLSLPVSAGDGSAAASSPYPLVPRPTSPAFAAPSDNTVGSGQKLYSTYCAACHQANGEGVPGTFPPLKGSGVVNRVDARRHIDIVLGGLQGARVSGVSYTNPMPAFGATLSDADIAAVIDYERGAWGNHGSLVGPAQVAGERARLN